jgi:hypothetical protein
MRPEHAAHRRKITAPQTFEQARVIPELELYNVRSIRQPRHLFEAGGDNDARARGFD